LTFNKVPYIKAGFDETVKNRDAPLKVQGQGISYVFWPSFPRGLWDTAVSPESFYDFVKYKKQEGV
jgi:hypothetical protein